MNGRPFKPSRRGFEHRRLLLPWVLSLLMAAGVATALVVVNSGHGLLMQHIADSSRQDLVLLGAALGATLEQQDHDQVHQLVKHWAQLHHDIARLEVSAPNHSVLARYERPSPAVDAFAITTVVGGGDRPQLRLSLQRDIAGEVTSFDFVSRKLIVVFVAFSLLTGLLLWWLVRYVAFRPLQQEIIARQQAEDELRRSYDELEQRVAARTRDLSESEQRFRILVEHAPEAILVIDVDTGLFVDANANARTLYGYSQAALLERAPTELCPSFQSNGRPSAKVVLEAVERALTGEAPVFDWTILTAKGEQVPCEARLVRLPAADRRLVRASLTDISRRRQSDLQMRLLSNAMAQTTDLVYVTDSRGMIQYANRGTELCSGYSEEELLGNTPNIFRSGMHDDAFYKDLWSTIKGGESFNGVIANKHRDGHIFYEEKTITPIKNGRGVVTHFVSAGRDVTDKMRVKARLEYLAHHDQLTGLPNRTLVLDRLHHVLSQRTIDPVAVLYMDVDNFKAINDSLGHPAGDALLVGVASRLTDCVREGDTVARMSGDEFAVIVEDYEDLTGPSLVAQKILDTLKAPFRIGEQEVFVGTSIGITICPGDGTDVDTLLRNADAAMYRAKAEGGNNYQFFTQDMTKEAVEQLHMRSRLHKALQRNEFSVHFQPRIALGDARVTSLEALLRWNNPALGSMPPARFIPVLEQTGLIVEVGDWVLRQACQFNRQRIDAGKAALPISVNVSARQFRDKQFPQRISEILAETSISPCDLELEITEGLLVENVELVAEVLNALHDAGVRIALDDFGTGYSAMSYLKRFPIDRLKIDRSFVLDLCEDPNDAAMVKAIIGLGRALGFAITAEGVESDAQLEFLRAHGCDEVQGFLFSRALPPDEVDAWVNQYGETPAAARGRLRRADRML